MNQLFKVQCGSAERIVGAEHGPAAMRMVAAELGLNKNFSLTAKELESFEGYSLIRLVDALDVKLVIERKPTRPDYCGWKAYINSVDYMSHGELRGNMFGVGSTASEAVEDLASRIKGHTMIIRMRIDLPAVDLPKKFIRSEI